MSLSFYQFNRYLETGHWDRRFVKTLEESWIGRTMAPMALGAMAMLSPNADAGPKKEKAPPQETQSQMQQGQQKVQKKTVTIEVPWKDSNDTPFFAQQAQKEIIKQVRALDGQLLYAEDDNLNVLYRNGQWSTRNLSNLMTNAKGGKAVRQITIQYVK